MRDYLEDSFFIGEDDYKDRMESEVKPWLREYVRDGYMTTTDGKRLHFHFAVPESAKAVIVMVHGFCEFFGKYHEMCHYFYKAGYGFCFLEQRGHGFSEREVKDPDMVHVDSFEDYVQDLHEFIHRTVKGISGDLPLFLFSHSMGGAVSALYLEAHPEVFKGAILSSPMIKLSRRGVKERNIKLLMFMAMLLRWDKKYAPGQHGFDNVYSFDTSSSSSEARYDYIFRQRQETKEYRTYGSDYSWSRNAFGVTKRIMNDAAEIVTPVLLLIAGKDTLVDEEAQMEFAGLLERCSVEKYPDVKHELYNGLTADRMKYYRRIFSFLEEECNE